MNNLCRDWRYRIKYVDDTSVFESIPRCSPSYLPFIAAHINTYASMRNMRLNEIKCKDIVISFLKYQPTVITRIQLNGIVIERVSSHKLLGVIITNDLSWNEHCDSIHKKATKRLFVLRTLKRVGLGTKDLVLVYCSIVRSIVEYASPVWAAIPLYLDELIESVQRKALKIIFGRVDYTEALVLAGLESLSDRRVGACKRFMATARQMSPLKNIIPSPAAIESHYSIRVQLPRRQHGHTRRINDFVTYKFQ